MIPAALKVLWRNDRERIVVVAALLAMVGINQLGTGMLFALIPVKLAADGYPASAAGIISTVFSICFMAGCIVGPRIAAWIGPSRTPAVLAGVNALLALLHWAFPGPVTWALFRGLGGLTTATYFVLIESWFAAQTTPATRGLVFGLYMTMNRLAFALGQIVLAWVAPSAIMQLFLVSAVAYLISPLARPRGADTAPSMRSPSLSSYLELPRIVPASAAGALMHGLVFGSAPGLVPKWGVDAGVGVDVIAKALTAVQLGGLFLQLPVSYASDRFERRTVMAFVCTMTALSSLALLWMPAKATWLWFAMLFLWGGFSSTLYSLSAAHANDHAAPEQRVAWVSSIMLLWATGAAIGPLIASLAMDWHGTNMLWVYSCVVSVVIGVFLLWRKVVRPE